MPRSNLGLKLSITASILSLLLVLGGCSTSVPITAHQDLLLFLAEGASRETVILELGEPSASFEQDRILTYRIGEVKGKGFFLLDRRVPNASQGNAKYSLVLVFDDKGILSKHKLVKLQ